MTLADVVPTVLATIGVERPNRFDGMNLLPMLEAGQSPGPRPVVSVIGTHTATLRAPPWKLYRSRDGIALYDLRADPGERRDVAADHPEIVAALRRQLDELTSQAPRRPPADTTRTDEIDPKLVEQLRALGYTD